METNEGETKTYVGQQKLKDRQSNIPLSLDFFFFGFDFFLLLMSEGPTDIFTAFRLVALDSFLPLVLPEVDLLGFCVNLEVT